MTQSDVDVNFLNGLQLMIDSMATSHLEKSNDPDIPGRFSDAPDPIKRVSHNGDDEHLPEDQRPLDSTIAGGGQVKYQRNIQNADEEDNREVASTDWESTNGLPDADHWCPDVQAWHTSDHEPAKAPSVHVNVDSKEGDDPYQSENGEVEKAGSVKEQHVDMATGTDPLPGHRGPGKRAIGKEYDQNTNLDRHNQENSEDSIAEPFLHRREVNEDEEEENEDIDKQWDAEEHEQEAGENIDIAPKGAGGGYRRQGRLPEAAQRLPTTKHGFAEFDENIDRGEHAFENPDSYEDDETADSADVRKSTDGFIDAVEQTHGKAIYILKLWASVDRVMPKTEVLVNDINILKSFDLDETTNVEDLVTGTLVHKMLVDRNSRPTADWWDSSMSIAKSIDSIDEPAFFSAFLYYEPDTFKVSDFIDIEKAERSAYGVSQDLEEMPNNSGGSPMGGLGMSADGLELSHGPKDEDCDD